MFKCKTIGLNLIIILIVIITGCKLDKTTSNPSNTNTDTVPDKKPVPFIPSEHGKVDPLAIDPTLGTKKPVFSSYPEADPHPAPSAKIEAAFTVDSLLSKSDVWSYNYEEVCLTLEKAEFYRKNSVAEQLDKVNKLLNELKKFKNIIEKPEATGDKNPWPEFNYENYKKYYNSNSKTTWSSEKYRETEEKFYFALLQRFRHTIELYAPIKECFSDDLEISDIKFYIDKYFKPLILNEKLSFFKNENKNSDIEVLHLFLLKLLKNDEYLFEADGPEITIDKEMTKIAYVELVTFLNYGLFDFGIPSKKHFFADLFTSVIDNNGETKASNILPYTTSFNIEPNKYKVFNIDEFKKVAKRVCILLNILPLPKILIEDKDQKHLVISQRKCLDNKNLLSCAQHIAKDTRKKEITEILQLMPK